MFSSLLQRLHALQEQLAASVLVQRERSDTGQQQPRQPQQTGKLVTKTPSRKRQTETAVLRTKVRRLREAESLQVKRTKKVQ